MIPEEPTPASERIAHRTALLEAVLDSIEEGVILLDADARVAFWNQAATTISGYPRESLLGRSCPPGFYRLDARHQEDLQAFAESQQPVHGHFATGDLHSVTHEASNRPILVELRHRLGHLLPAMLKRTPLRDTLGIRIGSLLRFHPAEDSDQLPHGDSGEGVGVEHSQAEMEDRLDQSWRDWSASGLPFGLLWITIDQAERLRKTHGRDACESMLQSMTSTIRHGLKPTEILGRWGDNEFLVLAHERTPEMLLEHARQLLGLTRTAEFRWWGDRVSLTASIGLAHASPGDTLSAVMQAAQKAMQKSLLTGGNRVSHPPDRIQDTNRRSQSCSQS